MFLFDFGFGFVDCRIMKYVSHFICFLTWEKGKENTKSLKIPLQIFMKKKKRGRRNQMERKPSHALRYVQKKTRRRGKRTFFFFFFSYLFSFSEPTAQKTHELKKKNIVAVI